MHVTVSTTLEAEQRQELSHSQVWGNGLGVAQALHRHRPHTTQMIESEELVLARTGGCCCFTLGSGSTGFFGQAGWAVITDMEWCCNGLLRPTVAPPLVLIPPGAELQWRSGLPPTQVLAPLRGVSTYRFCVLLATLRGLVSEMGVTGGSSEVSGAGNCRAAGAGDTAAAD